MMATSQPIMTDEHRQALEQYQVNLLKIQELEAHNESLQSQFISSTSEDHKRSWECLRLELNKYLKRCPYARALKPVTMDDCRLELRRKYAQLEEICTWILVLPEETNVYPYWPEVDVTNIHYLLQPQYQTAFVRYLAVNKHIYVKFALN